MKRFTLIFMAAVLSLFLFTASAGATSYTMQHFDNEADAYNALDFWSGGSYTVLEDFEGVESTDVPGNHATGRSGYTSTGLGADFTAVSGIGQGSTSFDYEVPEIGIVDRVDDSGGRTANWDTPSSFGNQYLDSGDVGVVTLNENLIEMQYSSLFFFMFDVADVGGTMTVSEFDGTDYIDSLFDITPDEDMGNGGITFVGLRAAEGSYLYGLEWNMNNMLNDGYGLDDFGTASAPVPEPATMLLLGTGLLGVAAFGRKKLMKRS